MYVVDLLNMPYKIKPKWTYIRLPHFTRIMATNHYVFMSIGKTTLELCNPRDKVLFIHLHDNDGLFSLELGNK